MNSYQMQFDYVIQLPSNGISDTSMGSGSGEGIRCVTDDADTDFLDRRVCFGFTEKEVKDSNFKATQYCSVLYIDLTTAIVVKICTTV